MNKKSRSIKERLQRAKNPDTQREIIEEWVESWHAEHCNLIARLEQAIKSDNYDELCIATGQLKTVHEKKFKAIPNIINTLSNIDKR